MVTKMVTKIVTKIMTKKKNKNNNFGNLNSLLFLYSPNNTKKSKKIMNKDEKETKIGTKSVTKVVT